MNEQSPTAKSLPRMSGARTGDHRHGATARLALAAAALLLCAAEGATQGTWSPTADMASNTPTASAEVYTP